VTPKFFRTAPAFERWLAASHRTARAVLVGFHKVGSGKPSITYPEALDSALAHGWIDGVRQRLDDGGYTIRFTPRTKKSLWSAVNIRRAKKLIQQRRMKPAGFAAFRMRQFASFQALPPSMKRLYAFWIASAKREETRSRRLAIVIERCRSGKRIDPFHPFSRR